MVFRLKNIKLLNEPDGGFVPAGLMGNTALTPGTHHTSSPSTSMQPRRGWRKEKVYLGPLPSRYLLHSYFCMFVFYSCRYLLLHVQQSLILPNLKLPYLSDVWADYTRWDKNYVFFRYGWPYHIVNIFGYGVQHVSLCMNSYFQSSQLESSAQIDYRQQLGHLAVNSNITIQGKEVWNLQYWPRWCQYLPFGQLMHYSQCLGEKHWPGTHSFNDDHWLIWWTCTACQKESFFWSLPFI